MWYAIAAFIGALQSGPPPGDGEIYEHLSRPVIRSVEGNGQLEDVQLCLADALYSTGLPINYQQGRDRIVMISLMPNSYRIMASVTLTNLTSSTFRAELRVRGRGWDDRMTERVDYCVAQAGRGAD